MKYRANADPSLGLRWLVRARRGILAVQVLLILLAEAGTDVHLHEPVLIAVLVGWGILDLAEATLFLRRPVPAPAVVIHALVDLTILTAILALSGGPQNPLLMAYLVYLGIAAMVLPARSAWACAIAAMLLQALAVFHPVPVPGLAPEPFLPGHLLGHALSFDLSALALTWVVTRLSASLRAREEAELEAQRQRAITDRLAALGTLAAGVAHELGTPLGAMLLLSEEARGALPPDSPALTSLALLEQQVARSRAMLERLRVGDRPQAFECLLRVQQWVAEWRKGSPSLEVEVVDEQGPTRVIGAEESWRAALWTALDNARRAGAHHVSVRVLPEDEAIRIEVEDDGRGLGEEAEDHAGDPFWTGWGGTGLGLFVARTFARSVGGDLVLTPGASSGARATMRLPRVSQ